MKKKTQKELFIEIMTTYDLSEEHKAFCQERINALEKKSENRAKTDTQKENDVLKENILEFLADNPNSSVATIRSQLGLSSPQKASALIKILTTEGKVVKKEEKKIAYYSLASVCQLFFIFRGLTQRRRANECHPAENYTIVTTKKSIAKCNFFDENIFFPK